MSSPLGPPWSHSAPAGSPGPRRQTSGGVGGRPPEEPPGNPAETACAQMQALSSRTLVPSLRTAFTSNYSDGGGRRPDLASECPGHRGRPCPSPRSTHTTSESHRQLQLPRPTTWENTALDRILFMFKLVCVCTGQIFLCMAGLQITFTLNYVFLNVLIAHSITFIIIRKIRLLSLQRARDNFL